VSNLPSDAGGYVPHRFTAHLPTSAPLSRPRHRGRVSGQLPSNDHLEEQPRALRFPVGFRPPAFASWASCSRQEDSAIPYGWPTGPPKRPDSVGVPAFRTCEKRPGWVPSLLRGGGVIPAIAISTTGACRFSTASPVPRLKPSIDGAGITKHTKIHSRSPVRPSPRP
jgi:hypothetical protein